MKRSMLLADLFRERKEMETIVHQIRRLERQLKEDSKQLASWWVIARVAKTKVAVDEIGGQLQKIQDRVGEQPVI